MQRQVASVEQERADDQGRLARFQQESEQLHADLKAAKDSELKAKQAQEAAEDAAAEAKSELERAQAAAAKEKAEAEQGAAALREQLECGSCHCCRGAGFNGLVLLKYCYSALLLNGLGYLQCRLRFMILSMQTCLHSQRGRVLLPVLVKHSFRCFCLGARWHQTLLALQHLPLPQGPGTVCCNGWLRRLEHSVPHWLTCMTEQRGACSHVHLICPCANVRRQ